MGTELSVLLVCVGGVVTTYTTLTGRPATNGPGPHDIFPAVPLLEDRKNPLVRRDIFGHILRAFR